MKKRRKKSVLSRLEKDIEKAHMKTAKEWIKRIGSGNMEGLIDYTEEAQAQVAEGRMIDLISYIADNLGTTDDIDNKPLSTHRIGALAENLGYIRFTTVSGVTGWFVTPLGYKFLARSETPRKD